MAKLGCAKVNVGTALWSAPKSALPRVVVVVDVMNDDRVKWVGPCYVNRPAS